MYHDESTVAICAQILQVEASEQDGIRWWDDLKSSQGEEQSDTLLSTEKTKAETSSKNHGNPDNSYMY